MKAGQSAVMFTRRDFPTAAHTRRNVTRTALDFLDGNYRSKRRQVLAETNLTAVASGGRVRAAACDTAASRGHQTERRAAVADGGTPRLSRLDL